MTLRALQPNSEEQLTHQRADFIGRPTISKKCDGTIAKRTALRGHKFTHKLITRHALSESFADPVIVIQYGFDADAVRIRSQQIHPLVRPVVREVRFFQQSLNKRRALIGAVIRQEFNHPFRSRNSTADIGRSSPQERVIAAWLGRRDVQSLQLLPNQIIDEVQPR